MSSLHLTGVGLPFFELGSIDLGIKLQWFGILVATGVLIGASIMRKYTERFGCDDEDLRGITAWVVVSGFLGAHILDVLAYQQDELAKDPLILLKIWKGISSYGGFVGGAIGWTLFVWWRRLDAALWSDIAIVGLLPAFTIGRIGCSVVHDHMGRATEFFLGVDYPKHELAERGLLEAYPQARGLAADAVIRIHNLGFYELLYLLPINAIILYLAFGRKPTKAGMLAALTGLLYAPVRFILEFNRLNETDPRYFGFTFAQWMSIVAFVAAAWVLARTLRTGTPRPLAEELGPKQIGGRKDLGPRITRKHLAELDKKPQGTDKPDKPDKKDEKGKKEK